MTEGILTLLINSKGIPNGLYKYVAGKGYCPVIYLRKPKELSEEEYAQALKQLQKNLY